jgi:hypothetical protein
MPMPALRNQLAVKGDFWMRVWISGTDWAPQWVIDKCKLHGIAYSSYEGDDQKHLPIWNNCFWSEAAAFYRKLFADPAVFGGTALKNNPRLRFVYMPGAFTWAEFDYDVIKDAVAKKALDWPTYQKWYGRMLADLTGIFGTQRTKLVFTGEDFPYGPFGADENLLARKAVDAGMGIRTGITEVFNDHLSEAPAYGSHVNPDGHLTVDESLPVHNGKYVLATENECYQDCGYQVPEGDLEYVVKLSNLKALQLRMNWMYVVPSASYLAKYPQLWRWVRLSLGRKVTDSPDAWAALRDAEDTYWTNPQAPFETKESWPNRPWVRNLERWLVQRDVPGDGVPARATSQVKQNILDPANGTAYEALSSTAFYFDLDDRFFAAGAARNATVKVTYLDSAAGTFTVEGGAGGPVTVQRTGDGKWKTASVPVTDGFTNSLAGKTDLRVAVPAGSTPLTVRFVRVVRTAA